MRRPLSIDQYREFRLFMRRFAAMRLGRPTTCSILVVIAAPFALPQLAMADWGQTWGQMTWGSYVPPALVPALDSWGLLGVALATGWTASRLLMPHRHQPK